MAGRDCTFSALTPSCQNDDDDVDDAVFLFVCLFACGFGCFNQTKEALSLPAGLFF